MNRRHPVMAARGDPRKTEPEGRTRPARRDEPVRPRHGHDPEKCSRKNRLAREPHPWCRPRPAVGESRRRADLPPGDPTPVSVRPGRVPPPSTVFGTPAPDSSDRDPGSPARRVAAFRRTWSRGRVRTRKDPGAMTPGLPRPLHDGCVSMVDAAMPEVCHNAETGCRNGTSGEMRPDSSANPCPVGRKPPFGMCGYGHAYAGTV